MESLYQRTLLLAWRVPSREYSLTESIQLLIADALARRT